MQTEKSLTDRKYIVYTNEDNTLDAMVKLYEVDIADCIIASDPRISQLDSFKYYHLYPRLDGKWELPKNKGK